MPKNWPTGFAMTRADRCGGATGFARLGRPGAVDLERPSRRFGPNGDRLQIALAHYRGTDETAAEGDDTAQATINGFGTIWRRAIASRTS